MASAGKSAAPQAIKIETLIASTAAVFILDPLLLGLFQALAIPRFLGLGLARIVQTLAVLALVVLACIVARLVLILIALAGLISCLGFLPFLFLIFLLYLFLLLRLLLLHSRSILQGCYLLGVDDQGINRH